MAEVITQKLNSWKVILELRQQLHEARQSKIKANEQLVLAQEQISESRTTIDELKLSLDGTKSTDDRLESELAQARARHKLTVQEVVQTSDKAESEHFRAIEAERAKWEVREARLMVLLDKIKMGVWLAIKQQRNQSHG